MVGQGLNMGDWMQLMTKVKQLRNNPQQVFDIMLKQGQISQSQYDQIKNMNGDSEKIGKYLLQSQILGQGAFNELQALIPQFQQLI